jgi:hypothetical protein
VSRPSASQSSCVPLRRLSNIRACFAAVQHAATFSPARSTMASRPSRPVAWITPAAGSHPTPFSPPIECARLRRVTPRPPVVRKGTRADPPACPADEHAHRGDAGATMGGVILYCDATAVIEEPCQPPLAQGPCEQSAQWP